MTRPGARLRSLARRVCDASTMERLIDPVIADLQCEHAEALRDGQVWRSRWIRITGCMAFCKVAGLAALGQHGDGARAMAIALSTATVLTALAICVVLANTAATAAASGKTLWLVIYLVPQALTISVPVCLALGVFVWVRGKGVDAATTRTVLWLMRIVLLAAVANAGWLTPAANAAFRDVLAGGPAARGANELTFIALGQRVYQSGQVHLLGDPLPMTFWLNARLALAVAPVLLCVLALAGASTRHRRWSAAIVITTLALFAGSYLLFPAEDIAVLTRWLPAAAIAWLPNALVMTATFTVARPR